MVKVVKKVVKVKAKGGQANPAPPLGPALGQAGVDISKFVQEFNGRTKDKMGQELPVVITVYEDRTYTFIVKLLQSPDSANYTPWAIRQA